MLASPNIEPIIPVYTAETVLAGGFPVQTGRSKAHWDVASKEACGQ